jgi:hypothetical protein
MIISSTKDEVANALYDAFLLHAHIKEGSCYLHGYPQFHT